MLKFPQAVSEGCRINTINGKKTKPFNTLAKTLTYCKHLIKNTRDLYFLSREVTLQYTFFSRNVSGDVVKKMIYFIFAFLVKSGGSIM